MVRGLTKGIPQIIAMMPVSKDGCFNIKKIGLKHMGISEAERLFLDMDNEIILSAQKDAGKVISVTGGNRVQLPEEVLTRLDITSGALLGLVQRGSGIAVKKVEIVQEEGEKAAVYDIETAYKITRKAITNPPPDKLLPRLEKKYQDFHLKYDIRNFLISERTLEAWQARKILGLSEAPDEELRKELVKDRLNRQETNGSWENDVVLTARNLKELAELGMTREDREIREAVAWLLDRPQSPHNPGMWFLNDELVKEQEEVVERRMGQTRGPRERFRKLLNTEIAVVKAGNELIRSACGPRIVWPNALVLEALLALGYEDNERVQAAIQSLILGRWCECAYQHGFSIWSELTRKGPPLPEDIERDCMMEYTYGGIRSLDILKENVEYKAGMLIPRKIHLSKEDYDEYTLALDNLNVSGCEVVTTKALSQVKNPEARRMAEAHLWRFAGLQHGSDGEFSSGITQKYLAETEYLNLYSLYDSPLARAVILRSVPWIIKNQNKDGSWGEGKERESATLAVIRALKKVGLI